MKMVRSRGQTILKISPEPTFSMTCQVCNVIDSINCCDLCNRMMCTRDTVYVNKKTLVENNIDLEKNKVILKQGDKSLLVKLLVDENVSDNCIYISNSNREHFEVGKQYQPIVIENV